MGYLLLAFLLPFAVTLFISGIGNGLKGIKFKSFGDDSEVVNVSVQINNATKKLSENEYIAGVIAPGYEACSEKEYLKTLAVLVRTYIKYMEESKEDYTKSLTYFDDVALKNMWGDDWENRKNYVLSAVAATGNEYLDYDGKAIFPYTHYITSGFTRVKEDAAYTCEVGQEWQCTAPDFTKAACFDNEEFCAAIKSVAPNAMIDADHPALDIQILSKTRGGYVDEVQIGNIVFKGDDVANILGLNSSAFTFDEISGKLICTTKGIGQGYGLSLYGAMQMAGSGTDYKEICSFFYSGVAFEKSAN